MKRGTRSTAVPGRRVRIALLSLLVLSLLAGGSLYLADGAFSAGSAPAPGAAGSPGLSPGCGGAGASPCAATPVNLAVAAPPAVAAAPPGATTARVHPTGTKTAPLRPPAPVASSTSPATPEPTLHPTTPATGMSSGEPSSPVGSAPASRPASAPASTPASAPASTPASTPASPPASSDAAAAAQVLALINQARATAGLPALSVSAGLETSSSRHTLKMAGGCGLSHQCPGEAALGDRETAAGVHWTAAGENIGEGGPVSDASAAIAQMAVGLTQSMLNEQPPDDGHRLNILSSSYTHIGIAVYRDSSGTVWLTQDFSN